VLPPRANVKGWYISIYFIIHTLSVYYPRSWRWRQRERYLSILLSSDLSLCFFLRRWCLASDRRGGAWDPGLSRVTGTTNGPRVRASLTARPWHPSDCIRPLRVDHVISWKWKRAACAEPIQARDTIACNLSHTLSHPSRPILASSSAAWYLHVNEARVESRAKRLTKRAWIVGGDMNERVYLPEVIVAIYSRTIFSLSFPFRFSLIF